MLGINKMKLFLRIPAAIFAPACRLRAKPRYVLKSNRYANYGPVPKTERMLIVDGRSEQSKVGNRKSAMERWPPEGKPGTGGCALQRARVRSRTEVQEKVKPAGRG